MVFLGFLRRSFISIKAGTAGFLLQTREHRLQDGGPTGTQLRHLATSVALHGVG